MTTSVHSINTGLSVCHLVAQPQAMVLVDAGQPNSAGKILAKMQAIGRDDLSFIFLTHAHFDHYGSAAELRRLTGAAIGIHALDAPALARGETPLGSVRGRGAVARFLLPLAERYFQPEPVQADVLVQDGDRLVEYGLDVEVMHTPGHTPGSSSLLANGGLAFVGDLISATGRPHPQRFYASDWVELAESLARLQRAKPAWVYAGHGARPVSGDAVQALQPAPVNSR